MKARLLIAGLVEAGAACDSDLHDVPLNELSDAELDEVCDDRVASIVSDRDLQLPWCLAEALFRASCEASLALCLDGPTSQPRVSCAHQPAANVTCELTASEQYAACKLRMSFRDALRVTPCTPGVTALEFLGEVNLKRGPCMRPPDCEVFSFGVGGFFADAGTSTAIVDLAER